MEWKNTIREVKRGDGHQWAIGDAIRKDVSGHGSRKFTELSKKLKGLGFDYTPDHLGRLHLTAERFKPADRDPNIPWGAHQEAGNPENLHRATEELEGLGKAMTVFNVAWLIAEWQKAAEKARQKKRVDAKERVRKASTKKAAAGRRKLSAKTDQERQEAQAEFDQAKQEVKEAIEGSRLIPTEPIGHDEALDPEAMPAKSDLELLALCLKVETNARLMLKTIETDFEAIGPELDRVQASQINHIIKRYEEIEVAAKKFLTQVRKHGFKVVGGTG
jgi:hypothetical protein